MKKLIISDILNLTDISIERANDIVKTINGRGKQFGINNDLRLATFLAVTAFESGGFKQRGANKKEAERERTLTHALLSEDAEETPSRYSKRGYLPIFGENEYRALKEALKVDCVSYPSLVADHPLDTLASMFIFQRKGLITLSDAYDLKGIYITLHPDKEAEEIPFKLQEYYNNTLTRLNVQPKKAK